MFLLAYTGYPKKKDTHFITNISAASMLKLL